MQTWLGVRCEHTSNTYWYLILNAELKKKSKKMSTGVKVIKEKWRKCWGWKKERG